MKSNSTHIDHSAFLKGTNRQLFIILLLMIACFFTWSENINITRLIKVVGRMGVLFASFLVYRKIIRYGAVDNLKWQNVPAMFFYGAYLALGFASFMWSTKVGYSVLQWFMTAQTLVFCYFFIKSLYLLDIYFPTHRIQFYNLLGNAAFALLSIFIVGMWVAPDVFFRLTHGGEEARLGGYMMNPNELGMLAGLGIACLIFDLKKINLEFRQSVLIKKWSTLNVLSKRFGSGDSQFIFFQLLRRSHPFRWTVFKLLILFYALYATGSRSSLIGVLLIIGFHVYYSSQLKLKLAVFAAMLFITPIAVNKIILKDGDTSRVEEVMSMTGRLPFWKALINEGLPREPWLGFGFMRIAYKDYFQGRHTYPGQMTHNTFIQVLMNLGFVGLALIIFQLLFTFKGIFKETATKRLVLLSLLIPLIINSLTEFGIFGESNYGILFYQLILFYICFKPHTILTPKQRIHLKKRRPELAL